MPNYLMIVSLRCFYMFLEEHYNIYVYIYMMMIDDGIGFGVV